MIRQCGIIITLSAIIWSCTDNDNNFKKSADVFLEKKCGITIENGPRQGFKYFNSLGTEYFYICKTTTITNDTTIPLDLSILFAKEYNNLRSSKGLTSKVFLLPRELTSEKQQHDLSMSEKLKKFLNSNIKAGNPFNKTLNPTEKCIMTFGILTDMKNRLPNYFGLKLKVDELLNTRDSIKTKIPTDKSFSVPLIMYLDNPYVIPCGQILLHSK